MMKKYENPKYNAYPQDYVDQKVWFYLFLLTLQYGCQPIISKRFISKQVNVTSSVLACDIAKVICAVILIIKDAHVKKLFKDWSLISSFTASGLPAVIYALQNSLLQISYRNLDSLTFSMLNQTKLFFTALFSYILLRQKQSRPQILALFILMVAAFLLSIGEGAASYSKDQNSEEILFYGIIPVTVASILSGLASALCQRASQVKQRSPYVMTIEMSLFGSLCLMVSTYKSPDGRSIRGNGIFYGWTLLTLIPVLSNAGGGILVGLVTSQAGGVRKGFVLVTSLLVTAMLQFILDGKPPSKYCLIALPLVICSIILYQRYPYRPILTVQKKKDG